MLSKHGLGARSTGSDISDFNRGASDILNNSGNGGGLPFIDSSEIEVIGSGLENFSVFIAANRGQSDNKQAYPYKMDCSP
jgi:hypothetical protein